MITKVEFRAFGDLGTRIAHTNYENGQVAILAVKGYDKKLYQMYRFDKFGNNTFFGGFATLDKLNFFAGLYGVAFNDPYNGLVE